MDDRTPAVVPEAPEWAYDDIHNEAEEDGSEPGEECGRWRNGRLVPHCLKAGSEECDWECPYGR